MEVRGSFQTVNSLLPLWVPVTKPKSAGWCSKNFNSLVLCLTLVCVELNEINKGARMFIHLDRFGAFMRFPKHHESLSKGQVAQYLGYTGCPINACYSTGDS